MLKINNDFSPDWERKLPFKVHMSALNFQTFRLQSYFAVFFLQFLASRLLERSEYQSFGLFGAKNDKKYSWSLEKYRGR